MNGAQFLVRALEREGVDIVFGYPGGAIMPVYDALVDSRIRHILTRHEQGAALAADGYARATGRVGVCLATSGPGATNLVTGIANAFLDSVPMVAITGQVGTPVMGTDAFQEVDVFGITMPIVKHSFLVRRAEDLPEAVHEAFRIARSGRPGPVLVDLPKDVAMAQSRFPFLIRQEERPEHPTSLKEAAALLRQARRPLIYAGGGIGMANAVFDFRRFVQTTQLPVVSTLKGLGALPTDHPLFLGMLGMHGWKNANLAVQKCDLLLAVGARFDDRVTGKLDTFAPEAKVIHLDIDPAEVGKLRKPEVSVIGDLRTALRVLAIPLCIDKWWDEQEPVRTPAARILQTLSERFDENTIVTCDVGQHQMWVAQHCRILRPELHLSSGGLGTMGYGLPAAIGAQLGRPTARVINVSGDGSFMMNIQELATLRRYGLPVKILLFDNQALGMVRQWQELFFEERYSEVDLSDNPDFVRVAEAFGIPGHRVEREEDLEPIFGEGPLLAHIPIDPKENVWPLVPPGASNTDMMEGAAR